VSSGNGNGDRFTGRNRISSRAIRAVTSAIAADELDTVASRVSVELGDDSGALLVSVSAPVGIASRATTRRHRAATGTTAPTATAPTILERATNAQSTIRERVLELTGSTVGRVNVRLTAAHIEGHERVQ
jgi:hypothetical protein